MFQVPAAIFPCDVHHVGVMTYCGVRRKLLGRASKGISAGTNRTTVFDILICVLKEFKKSVLETNFDQVKIPEAILMFKRTIW